MAPYIDIHTHHPTGRAVELRTAGIHPWEAAERTVDELLPLAEGVQAIGEIGLDARRGPSMECQTACFREQLQLAVAAGLPVVLHCVHAFEAVVRELRRCEPRAVIFHGFVGSAEQAREAVRRGWWLSFGERSFASQRTLAAFRELPLERIFLETDERTTPIEAIYARAAEIRAVTVAALRIQIETNYERIFNHG